MGRTFVLIRCGVSPWGVTKPLVDDAIDQDPHLPPRGFHAFLPCRAAVVCPDPHLCRRGHPPSPQADRVVLAPQLKTWHILRKLRCCPWRAGHIAKAIHVLQAREIAG